MFKAREIKPGIHWVGALEWKERYIHGITMPLGSTNNAYLIMDEKVVLVDTCVGPHAHELLERVSSVTDPARIDYIVSNHGEKDHAGSIGEVLAAAPNATVVTSDPKGLAILKTYLPEGTSFLPMKNGDTLSIGARTLQFIHTPMVHWPDNMVTYCREDSVLFSNDAFGQFIATSKRFDDEVHLDTVLSCAKKYFANIITPYAKQAAKAVEAVRALDLELICPAHGVIWRSNVGKILGLYEKLCRCEPDDSAVVVYSSMYGSTERMALAITEAFMEKGVNVRCYDIDVSDMSDIVTDVFFAKYVAVGSPTHNNTTLPTIGAFLTYLKGLAPKGRIGISFGSFGWVPGAQKEIAEVMQKAGFVMPLEPFTEGWNDTPAGAARLFDAVCNLVADEE